MSGYAMPENAREAFMQGITAHEMSAASPLLTSEEIELARRLAGGARPTTSEILDLAKWWANNSRMVGSDASEAERVIAQLKGGKVGRSWIAETARQIREDAARRAWTKSFTDAQDTENIVSARWMPYFGIDTDGNYYDSNTRVHKAGEIVPGVLDTHGLWLGGDANDVGNVVGSWDNSLGRYYDIQLNPNHPRFEEYKRAAQENNLMCSAGFIPGYFDINMQTGYVTDAAVGEISLIILDGTQKGKHPGSIVTPYSERDKLNSLKTFPTYTKAERDCATCRMPGLLSKDRAQALFKSCGVDYTPLIPPPVASADGEQNRRMEKKNMSMKSTLKGVIKGVAGEGAVSDLLFRVLDSVLSDELDELSQDDADNLIKAIAEKPANDNIAADVNAMSEDDKKVLKAVLVKAGLDTLANPAPEGADPVSLENLRKENEALKDEVAQLRQTMGEQKDTIQGKDDAAWFTGLVKAGKANPSEQETALQALRDARRADALIKGGGTKIADTIIKTYNARSAQTDGIQLDEAGKAALLAKGAKIVGYSTDADRDAEIIKKKIEEDVRKMLSGSPEGRQAAARLSN